MAGIIGIIVIIAVLVWLYKASDKGIADCSTILGLPRVPAPVSSSGTSSEGFYFYQSLHLKGTLEGVPAELALRNMKRRKTVMGRPQGSHFTVLTLFPTQPVATSFRLQPAGMMGVIEEMQQGAHLTAPTGDAAFDTAYRLYTTTHPAPLPFSPPIRAITSPFTISSQAPARQHRRQMAFAFVLGSIEVEPGKVLYSLYGSPTAKIATHLKQVVPLLLRLTRPPSGRFLKFPRRPDRAGETIPSFHHPTTPPWLNVPLFPNSSVQCSMLKVQC